MIKNMLPHGSLGGVSTDKNKSLNQYIVEAAVAQNLNKTANKWVLDQYMIGPALNNVFYLNSTALQSCVYASDIANNPQAIADIKKNPNAGAFCVNSDVLRPYFIEFGGDELKLTSGEAYRYYNVGDKVRLNMTEFGEVVFDVIGKNHDGQNTITLCTRDIVQTSKWHSSDVNNYQNSLIRSLLNNDILTKFSQEIQQAIKPVAKQCHNAQTAITLTDKVWLLSCNEVGFTDQQPEGTSYGFFTSNDKRVKKFGGNALFWWLRTPSSSALTYARGVNASGSGDDNLCSIVCGVVFGLVF